METWEGKRLGQSGAVDEYEASKAYSFQDYEKILPNLLRGFIDIYCDYSSNNFDKYDKKFLPMQFRMINEVLTSAMQHYIHCNQ